MRMVILSGMSDDKPDIEPPKPRGPASTYDLKSVAGLALKAARPALGRQGFAETELLARWEAIAGPQLAEHTLPIRVIPKKRDEGITGHGGVLHLKVDSGPAAMMLSYMEPQIIERVNAYFGWKAIDRLKLIQGPLPGRPQRKIPAHRPLSAAEEAKLASLLESVDDPELKTALLNLGRAVTGEG
ncbi:MAG: DUF721 domain-containing protein [Alphaproteobacteria bacterium]|nr:DUF721 domain-containing protein [Alphaproteobacteria bacterium]